MQYLADQFWVLWCKQEHHQLTLRRKWQNPTRCFTEGDVVLVRDPLAAGNNWDTGLVTKVIPSTDVLICSVELSLPHRSGEGSRHLAIRGIHSLVLLATTSELAVNRLSETLH